VKAPTSHDVARLVGVSQATVSRALRADPRVAEATRLRIQEGAAQLGYVPSRSGRSLSTRSTEQVAVVVSDLGNPFYAEAVGHLHAALEVVGRRMLILTDTPQRPGAVPERLHDGSVDGVIVTNVRLGSPVPGMLAERGLPFVLFNRGVDGAAGDVCISRNAKAAAAVAAELVALGHRRIGAIFGPRETSTGRDRENGFRTALAKAGVGLDERLVRRGAFTFATGHEALGDLLRAPSPPTAVFCANDVIAIGALNAAKAHGVDVPARLSLFGFDDIAMAGWELLSLSTVRQDLALMANTAVGQLLARIADPRLPPSRVTLSAELVLRGSHGRAPS
jgi:LacI family transcriptional regulator